MLGFTADGQVRDDLVAARDRRLGVSSAARRRSRADIPTPPLVEGADGWESGRTVQTRLEEVAFRRGEGPGR